MASAVHPGTCLVFPSPTWAASETVKAIQKEKYIHTHTHTHKMCCIAVECIKHQAQRYIEEEKSTFMASFMNAVFSSFP